MNSIVQDTNAKNSKDRLRSLVISIITLLLIGWAIIYAVTWSTDVIKSLDSDLAKTLAATTMAIIGSAITVSMTKRYETKAAIRNDLRKQKAVVYESVISTLYNAIFSLVNSDQSPEVDELKDFFASATRQLTIWGSDNVLKEFGNWKQNPHDELSPINGLLALEKLVLAMREDLGHENKKLVKGDLLRLFVNDMPSLSAT